MTSAVAYTRPEWEGSARECKGMLIIDKCKKVHKIRDNEYLA